MFVSVPLIALPLPFGMPVTLIVLSRVQLKMVFVTFPLRVNGEIEAPEQISGCVPGVIVTPGVGLTITVAVVEAPTQPAVVVGVIIKVTV